MRIVDFKCELRDPDLAHAVCVRAGMMLISSVSQRDTHYRAPDAHLMRRESAGGLPEWLFYTRKIVAAPRVCTVNVYTESMARARFGRVLPPVMLVVHKRRTAWLWRGVRVNLDDVRSLGVFVEIEAPVGARKRERGAVHALRRVRELLGPSLGEPVACSYRDLIVRDKTHNLGAA